MRKDYAIATLHRNADHSLLIRVNAASCLGIFIHNYPASDA